MKTAHIHMNDQRLCQANVNVDARGRKKMHWSIWILWAPFQCLLH